jgi:hypothetical protein
MKRVQFDRATANVYKSNAYIQFDKTIYLDRYLDTNFIELKDRRTQVAGWRSELSKYQEQVKKYSKAEVKKKKKRIFKKKEKPYLNPRIAL